MIVRELVTEWGISVDMAKLIAFDRKLEDVKRTVNGLGDSIKRIGEGISSVGTKLTLGLTVPLVALGGVSLHNAARMEALKMGLVAVTGSAELAAAQLKQLNEVAKLPGLGLPEAIQGATALQAAKFSGEAAIKTMKAFGNAIATTGGGKNELDRVIVQLTQMAGAGKVLQGELRPIVQIAPLIGTAMRTAFGTVDPQKIEEMGFNSRDFIARLTEELAKLPPVTGGLKNSFENLNDSWIKFTAALGGIQSERINGILNAIGDALDYLAAKIDSLPQWAKDFLALGLIATAALGPMVFILGKIVSMIGSFLFFKAVLFSMGSGFGALAASVGAALLPFIAWGAAIVGVGALLYMLYDNAGEIFNGIIGWVKDVAYNIGHGISTAVQTAIEWLKKLPEEAITSVKGFFGIEQGTGNAQSGALGGLGPFAPIPPSVAGSNSTTNSTAITAPITVNVPEGTTVEQADNIARIASKTVTAHLDTMLRNAQGSYR